MLIRISLIVAILAGLAVGVVNFVQVKDKIETLKANLAEQTKGRQDAEASLAKTKRDLAKTIADLKTSQENLAAATEAKNKALADLDVVNKKYASLNDEYTKTKKERDDFQADLSSYKQIFPTSADAAAAGKQIKSLQDTVVGVQAENELLGKKVDTLQHKVDVYEGKHPIVYLPRGLQGKVLVFDPKWEFVVLDIGEEKGVKQDGELLVSRDGKLVAKIIVRSVDKTHSIANVVTGWKLGELLEGDLVVPANPES